jgi:hypothetical protein
VAIQKVPIEVSVFVKGLITEASPLTFPENASIDERNFVLNRDGTRNRRLGMDILGDVTNIPTETEEGKVFSAFEWENAGGIAENLLIAIQYGKDLMVFDLSDGTPSLVSTFDLKVETASTKLNIERGSFASVDGVLVGVFGEHAILRFEYATATNTISVNKIFLKIRDQFGIQVSYVREESEQVINGLNSPEPISRTFPARDIDDMLDDESVYIRPFTEDVPSLHYYNLRNQSWGRPRPSVRLPSKDVGLPDPIAEFSFNKVYAPSNADAVPVGLINYAELVGAPVRFVAEELGITPLVSSSSARGFFIIDALKRGESRLEQHDRMFEEAAGKLTVDMTSTPPLDTTPDGARAVAEFGGRLWYSGFTGDTLEPDKRSPRMSSYVLFSQLVTASSNLDKCYQKNDPTYEQEADLLATDGGVIRLDEAYGIKELVSVGSSLLVFAANGVWAIKGGTEVGFSAEAYVIEKITDQGALNAKSIVEDGNTVFYWSSSGIFAIAPNSLGTYSAQSLTKSTIQKFYEAIPLTSKVNASGVYDRYENKLKWTYSGGLIASISQELVLDLNLQAFYPNICSTLAGETPTLLSPIVVRPFAEYENTLLANELETMYISLWSANPLQIAFCIYRDTVFKDWTSKDGNGVDAAAYFITGYGPQGDFQRRKQVPSITSYMTKTEDGFILVDGDLVPANSSSCVMQARWDWHNSPSGNRWGRENQLYKNKRVYMPEDAEDDYDTGEEVITTKTKVRGHGKTLSLLFKTEPEKDCKLLGWSMITDVSTNV